VSFFISNFRKRDFSWLDFSRIAILILLVALAADYALQRTLSSQSSEINEITYPYPYVMFRARPKAEKINSHGWRSPEPGPKIKPRIIVMGNSVVYGSGLADENLISAHLQRYFSKRGHDYEWIPAGYHSAVSSQLLTALVQDVSEARPDHVVLLDGLVDISVAFSADPRPGYPLHFKKYERALKDGSKSSIRLLKSLSWRDIFLLKTNFADLFPARDTKRKILSKAANEEISSEEVEDFPLKRGLGADISPYCHQLINNWKKMSWFAKGAGFKVSFALQAHQVKTDEETRMYQCIRSSIERESELRDQFIDFDRFASFPATLYTDKVHPKSDKMKDYADSLAALLEKHPAFLESVLYVPRPEG
jgi:hypothetical protein